MKNILILNGPNLNMLGIREPEIYGSGTYADLCDLVCEHAKKVGISVRFFQSNHEGALIDEIQKALGNTDGIVFNPAGYTHTSVALLDALLAVKIPTVEVHISDVENREPFRKVSLIKDAVIGSVSGQGFAGYLSAIDLLLEAIR